MFLPTICEYISAVFFFILKTETELLSYNSDTPMTADYRPFQERTVIVTFYDVC